MNLDSAAQSAEPQCMTSQSAEGNIAGPFDTAAAAAGAPNEPVVVVVVGTETGPRPDVATEAAVDV